MKIFLLAILFFISLFSISCNSTKADTSAVPLELSQSLETAQDRKTKLFTDGKVEFHGVSFNYNSQIFGEVEAEEVAESPLESIDDKPDYVTPQQIRFTFELATPYSAMEVAVFPINDFPRMYAVNKESVIGMEKEITDFRNILKDKNFRVEGQIPFLLFRDASQSFQAKVKHYNFQNGRGILFLTFWSTQFEFPSNRQLRYVFEGLTNDGKYYVLAEVPASVSFLPDESSEEFEGYRIPWGKLNNEAEMKRFSKVIKNIGKRLENFPQNEFKPNPKYFEELISSLKVEK